MFPSPPHSRPPIRALLIDLSGTLHVGLSPCPRAVEALAKLRTHNATDDVKTKLPYRFCSNTSKESRADLEARLRSLGFKLRTNESGTQEMWTSLGAVSDHLRRKGLSRPFCLLEPSARDEVLRDVLGDGGAADADKDQEYDSVVIGLAPSLLTYTHLTTAFRVLLRPNKPLIATHTAKYVRTTATSSSPDNTSLSLGPGPFVAALENATGVKATVLGKPSRAFFETVIASLGDDAEGEGKVVIVGDDVETDLGGGAVELGLWRVLVRTGKYRVGDERREGVTPPDEVWDTFADFVDSLLDGKR
ncbi:hypothetical protein BDW22DRAFT_869936 [Trametopsis cervina]|nr:hypothetical protein BDW22DRAFT_869936 [Trametopsis cervina]